MISSMTIFREVTNFQLSPIKTGENGMGIILDSDFKGEVTNFQLSPIKTGENGMGIILDSDYEKSNNNIR